LSLVPAKIQIVDSIDPVWIVILGIQSSIRVLKMGIKINSEV